MKDSKKLFIENEILNLTISGAFRKAKIYKEGINEKVRNNFHKDIKIELENLFINNYLNKIVRGEEHFINIRNYQEKISNKYGSILKENKISYGVSQKLINLYLKYKWVLGEIKNKPPHCPLDSQILNIIGFMTGWTNMNGGQYREAINIASVKIGGEKKLAEWELNLFNKENIYY